MNGRPADRVQAALAGGAAALPRDAAGWSLLVAQARAAGLLARVATLAGATLHEDVATLAGATPSSPAPCPAAAAGHLESALRVARAQRAEVLRELGHLRQALAPLGAPVVLLKGAAYVAAGLPPARARVFSDIDLLVPHERLGDAEQLLGLAGWRGTHLDAYDQRYYREWMHELPPLEHAQRGTTLDVHHAILPRTSRLGSPGAALLEATVPLPAHPGLSVLGPEDMVLHAMTHLFVNDDVSHALRDLSDLDLLLRHFGSRPGFWDALPGRAERLGLQRPLHFGLRHCAALLGTPVPAPAAAAAAAFGPAPPVAAAADWMWRRALRPQHPSTRLGGQGLALAALYLRGHWLRMPLPLLVRHLAVKSFKRLGEAPADDAPRGPG